MKGDPKKDCKSSEIPVNVTENVAVISESKLQSLQDSHPKVKQNSMCKTNQYAESVDTSKSTKCLSQARNKLHVSSVTAKHSIDHCKAGSGDARRKYVPAHESAPFQTKTAYRKIKPGQTRSQLLRSNANNKVSGVSSSTVNKLYTASARISKGKVQDFTEKNKLCDSRVRVNEVDTLSQSLQLKGTLPNVLQEKECDKIVQRLGYMQLDHSNLNNNALNSEEEQNKEVKGKEEPRFLLQRDGYVRDYSFHTIPF